MNRRNFLQKSALTGALCAVAPHLAFAGRVSGETSGPSYALDPIRPFLNRKRLAFPKVSPVSLKSYRYSLLSWEGGFKNESGKAVVAEYGSLRIRKEETSENVVYDIIRKEALTRIEGRIAREGDEGGRLSWELKQSPVRSEAPEKLETRFEGEVMGDRMRSFVNGVELPEKQVGGLYIAECEILTDPRRFDRLAKGGGFSFLSHRTGCQMPFQCSLGSSGRLPAGDAHGSAELDVLLQSGEGQIPTHYAIPLGGEYVCVQTTFLTSMALVSVQ